MNIKQWLGSAVLCGAISLSPLSSAMAASLKMAYDADPVTLDIHEQLSGGTLQLSHMVFDPLVRYSPSMDFEPRLATRWERIDEKTVRFYLREGVKFHSGNPFSAKDVVWTFNRLKRSPDFKAIFEPFSALSKVDEYTVDLIAKDSFPLTLNVATYIFPLDSVFYTGETEAGEPKDEIVKAGNSFASRQLSGTGPYTVVERQQGVKVVFERFADYWQKDSKGNVQNITLTPIKEGPTRVAALLSGGVDFIAPVPPSDMPRIDKDPNVELVTLSGTRIITFQMNQQRVEAFKDARVRQAIAYAINNEAIAEKIMQGYATPAAQQSPKGYAGYHPDLKPRYDLAKAKALMKEAGYEKGFSISMAAPNNRYVNDAKIAQAVASMLSKIGIKVELTTMPKAQYWPEFDKRSADMMMIGWHADTEDSANFTEFLAACPDPSTGYGQYNSGNYCNPRVDALLKQANVETDTQKRAALLQEIEQKLYDDAAFIPLHWQDLAWAAHKRVDIKPVLNVMNFPYLGDLVIKE